MFNDTYVYYSQEQKDDLLYSLLLYYSTLNKDLTRTIGRDGQELVKTEYIKLTAKAHPELNFNQIKEQINDSLLIMLLSKLIIEIDNNTLQINYWRAPTHMIKINKEVLKKLINYGDSAYIKAYVSIAGGFDYQGENYIFYYGTIHRMCNSDAKVIVRTLMRDGFFIAREKMGYHNVKGFYILRLAGSVEEMAPIDNEKTLTTLLGW